MKKKTKDYITLLEDRVNCLACQVAEQEVIIGAYDRIVLNLTKKANGTGVQDVVFDDKNKTVSIVTDNGDTITAKCAKGERYSKETGIAICLAKMALSNTTFKQFVKNSLRNTEEDEKYAKIYRNLSSKYYKQRVKAQASWNEIPVNVRQSIKARVKNGSL